MKKLLSIFSLSFISLGLIFNSLSSNVKEAKAINDVEADIFSVQVRSGGEGLSYLVVNDHKIDTSTAIGFNNFDDFNAPQYINVYMAPDSEPVKLSSIINNNSWWCNLWMSYGIMFPIADYETYNGVTIYAIEILEGCTYPNNKFEKVVVSATKLYTNDNYNYNGENVEEIKNGSFNWSEPFVYPRGDTLLDIDGGELRSNYEDVAKEVNPEEHPEMIEYYIDLRCLLYDSEPTVLYNKYSLNQINAYEKILIHMEEGDEGILLRDVASNRSAKSNYWISSTFMFTLTAQEFATYNGASIYSFDVLEGCELIYRDTICKVSKGVSLINPHYHDDSFRLQNFDFYVLNDKETLDEPITLYGAQVRGQKGEDDEHDLLYINLLSNVYDNTELRVYPDVSRLNAYDKIIIHLSSEDEGIKLKDIAKTYKEAVQNQFSAVNNVPAFFFRLSTQEFETYNALSIYMVEVLEGCELYVDGLIGVVDKNYRFVNSNYGATFPDTEEGRAAEEEAKRSGFDFSPEVTEDDLVNFGKVTMQNIHNRMDKDTENRWLIFLFNENIYMTSKSVKQFINKINFLDNVLIYFNENDENPVKLRDIFDNNISGAGAGITAAQFGVSNTLGVSILNPKDEKGNYINDGPHMYKMVILAGTQFPSYENDMFGYRVLESKVMIVNDEYGLTGRLPPATRPDYIDEKRRRRTYSDWNIFWSVVPCLVTFTVRGIDNLEFEEMFLNIGQRVSLLSFAQDGYDLTATTSDGDKIYRYIIGANRTINVILEYKIHKDEAEVVEQKSCGGSIASTSILLSSIALMPFGLLAIRKRKEQ